jgi:hypothetical protein
MSLPTDDAAIAAWVRERLAALDAAPRDPRWRHKALGMTRGEAAATAHRDVRLDITLPVGEMRVLRDCAAARGLPVRAYVRRALGTVVVACDGVPVEMVGHLAKGGLLGGR